MSILETYQHSLTHFVPKTRRQFTLLQIARRFEDTQRLAKYLTLDEALPRKLLIEAARLSARDHPTDRTRAANEFFAALDRWKERGAI